MSMLLMVRRHLRTGVGATLALAVVALAAAALVSSVPRAVATLHADELAHSVAQTSAISKDVIATSTAVPGLGTPDPANADAVPGPGADVVDPVQPDVDGYLDGLRALADAQPDPLARVLGDPDLIVSGPRTEVERVEGNDVASPWVVLRSGPTAREQVDVVEGRWPEPTPVPAHRGVLLPGSDGVVEADVPPVEVAMSVAAADELGWEVGTVHATGEPLAPSFVLVGTWEPRDAGADYWMHGPRAAGPEVQFDPNIGKIVTAAAFADPGTLAAWVTTPSARIWYPVDATTVTAAEAPDLLAQLRGLTAATSVVVEGDPVVLEPASSLVDVLADALGRRQGVDAIVAVLAVGPLGALAAVLLLAARLVAERRRAATLLLRARGASSGWIRAMLALEGLAVGLPAAVLGLGLGLLAVPGPVRAGQVGAALACGVAPALALVLASPTRGLHAGRADLDAVPVRPRRARVLGEAGIVVAAAATSWLAVDRGVVTDPGAAGRSGGVDPLLVAAPLLLGLAVAVGVLRGVPPVVRLAEQVLSRRRDLVPFLGAARVRRRPAGGAVPAVALVLACGVAVSSTVLATTVRSGIEHEAWTAVGADVRVAGPVVDEDLTAQLAAVDGVTAVTPVADAGRYPVGQADGGAPTTVYTADSGALSRVQAGAPGAPTGLVDLGTAMDGRLPAVATDDVAESGRVLTGPGGRAVEIVVLDRVPDLPGLPPSSGALLVDAGLATELVGIDAGTSRLALLGLDDGLSGADRDRATADIAAVAPTGVVDDPADGLRELLSSPAASGLATAFVLAGVLSVLLCVATVVLMLVLAAPVRRSLLAVLRTLGLPRGAERGIVAWEVGPWMVAALLAGGALGLLVPALVLAVVDLSPLTGGGATPALVADPWWLAAVVGVLLGVVALGAAVAGALGRHREADDLRAGSR